MKQFFADHLPLSPISTDAKLPDEDDDGERLSETIADNETLEDHNQQIPNYDALDRDGNKLGWKLDTFASIIRKNRDTLKRWDKEGLLVPLRYPIYSPRYKKQIPYRAYVHEDIQKAREVEILKNKRARHQV
jgi:hypothetical protein